MTKRHLPLIFSLTILLIIIGSFIYSTNIFPLFSIKSRALEESNTGAYTVPLTAAQLALQNKIASLYTRCPVIGTGFTINKSNLTGKFTVFLQKPFSSSQTNFENWVSQNGYSELINNYFEVIAINLSPTPTHPIIPTLPIPPSPPVTPTPMLPNSPAPDFYPTPTKSPVASPTPTCASCLYKPGLQGKYYKRSSTGSLSLVTTRIDRYINFNWLSSTPFSSLGTNNFTIKWYGYLQAPTTGSYVIYLTANDTFTGTLNSNSLPHANNNTVGRTFYMKAGVKYPLYLIYSENTGTASVKLEWKGPNFSKTLIPASALYYK